MLVVGGHFVAVVVGRRQHEDHGPREQRIGANLTDQRDAVHAGHLDVDEQQIGRLDPVAPALPPQQFEGVDAVGGAHEGVDDLGLGEVALDDLRVDVVVLDEHNREFIHSWVSSALHCRLAWASRTIGAHRGPVRSRCRIPRAGTMAACGSWKAATAASEILGSVKQAALGATRALAAPVVRGATLGLAALMALAAPVVAAA